MPGVLRSSNAPLFFQLRLAEARACLLQAGSITAYVNSDMIERG